MAAPYPGAANGFAAYPPNMYQQQPGVYQYPTNGAGVPGALGGGDAAGGAGGNRALDANGAPIPGAGGEVAHGTSIPIPPPTRRLSRAKRCVLSFSV
jgi:hypothetical protein